MVQRVEEFRAEVERMPLRDVEFSREAKVYGLETGPLQYADPELPNAWNGTKPFCAGSVWSVTNAPGSNHWFTER